MTEEPQPANAEVNIQVLVVGPDSWGRGHTIDEAMAKCGQKLTTYQVFAVHPDTRVDPTGYINYPFGFAPKLIHQVKAKKKKGARG